MKACPASDLARCPVAHAASPSSTQPGFPPFPDDRDGLRCDDPCLNPFLAAIQGNILKGHGRDHTRLVFFRLGGNEAENHALLQDAVVPDPHTGDGRWVTSALAQRRQRDVWHRSWQERGRGAIADNAASNQLFASLFLSHSGLAAFGAELPSREFSRGMKRGMESTPLATERLTAHWDKPYTESYDGVFLLACENFTALEDHTGRLLTWLQAHHAIPLEEHIEQGTSWCDCGNPYGNGYMPRREAFGFVDGVSAPAFFREDRCGAGVAGRPAAWEWIDLRLRDVFLAEGPLAGGSYVALLKLEQDVATFRAYEDEIVKLLATRFPADQAARLAPALIMGRTRDGTPLPAALRELGQTRTDGAAIKPGVPRSPDALNEFDFSADPAGAQCPFHAHIRKMHPRVNAADTIGHKGSLVASQPVRRGTLYDPRGLLAARERAGIGPWPSGGVGLLFLAYMANLQAQFEQLHNTWAADRSFPDPRTGQRDPVLMGDSRTWTFLGIEFPPMPPAVRRLGGAYLLAPPIPWLARGGR